MSQQSIFPLPITPIELCWLLEDCPSHPMQFYLRLELNGHLKRLEFEQALQKTIKRHPLFTAIVEKIGRIKWQWVEGPTEPLPVSWQKGVLDDLPESPPLDISKERGLRVTVIENSNASAIVLQIQHTVCDGLGASEFASDLLSAYVEQLDPTQTVKFKKLNPTKLVDRGNSGLSKKQKTVWFLGKLKSLKSVHTFYKKKPILLLNRKRPEEHDPAALIPDGLFCRFSHDQSVAISNQARDTGKNLNSRLLTSMFTAFLDWRERFEPVSDTDLYRVTIPLSMRTTANRTVPAANMVSLICFDRTIDQTKDAKTLRQSIEAQIEQIVNTHLGLALPTSVRLLTVWPSELIGAIKRKRFSGTTLLSNLGPLLTTCLLPKEEGKIKVGDLRVEHAEFLAVIRPSHCATVAASSYAGKLTLAMHYDSRIMNSDEANSLFTNFADSLL